MKEYDLYKYPSLDVEKNRKKSGLPPIKPYYRLEERTGGKMLGSVVEYESEDKQAVMNYAKQHNLKYFNKGRFKL